MADLPALVVIPLALVTFSHSAPAGLAKPLFLGAAVLLLAIVAPIAGKDILGIGQAVEQRIAAVESPASQRIASEHLRDFVVPPDTTWQTAYRTANSVPTMLNDGIDLLHRHIAPGDKVAAVALTNPFSFALDLPPAGGVLWWDLDISFSSASHPDPDLAFGDARWIMVPRMISGQGCCQATVSAMLDMYGPYLQQHFTEVERTGDWILLSRTM